MIKKAMMNGLQKSVVKLLLLFWTVCMCDGVTVYKMTAGYTITSPVLSTRACDKFCRRTCLMACGCEPGCKSVSVNQPLQTCQLHQNLIYDEDTEFSASSDWEYHQVATDTVKKGEWTLVFRVTPSNGQSALTTWQDTGNYDDYPVNKDGVPPGCATTNSNKSCDRNFRSKILDDWASYNIQQVKLDIFKNGVSQHHVIFDGTGSDVNSWMSMTKIISTSWTDLMGSSYNFFSPLGYLSRHFYINKYHGGGCVDDNGWMVVIDSPLGSACAWEAGVSSIPAILFSSGNTSSYSGNWEVADVMAAYVKL